MRDDNWLKDNVSNIDELIDVIDSFGKTTFGKPIKDTLIVDVETKMAWARLRYDEGGADYAERIEFADFYFKLSDILKELHHVNEYEVRKIVILKLKVEKAYSSLVESVLI